VHAREHLELCNLKLPRRAHAGQNGLRLAGGAVDVETELYHTLNHLLNLFIGCVVLHGDDHHCIPR